MPKKIHPSKKHDFSHLKHTIKRNQNRVKRLQSNNKKMLSHIDNLLALMRPHVNTVPGQNPRLSNGLDENDVNQENIRTFNYDGG